MKIYFEDVKKNFGFGCMRFPMKDGAVDKNEMCRMVDSFLENGFNLPYIGYPRSFNALGCVNKAAENK